MLVHLSVDVSHIPLSIFGTNSIEKWHLSCQDVSDTSVEMPCHIMSCMSCLTLDWMLLSLSDVLRCQKFCPIICELECRLYATYRMSDLMSEYICQEECHVFCCFVSSNVWWLSDVSELMSDNMSGYLLLTLSKKMSVHNCFISFWTCQIRGQHLGQISFIQVRLSCEQVQACRRGRFANESKICYDCNKYKCQQCSGSEDASWHRGFRLEGCVLVLEVKSTAMYQWLNIHNIVKHT